MTPGDKRVPDLVHSSSEQGHALGASGASWSGDLDRIDAPAHCTYARYESDEVTGTCPVTSQPDFYIVTVEVIPKKYLPESKSLKLYLQAFAKDGGIFGEALAEKIATELEEALEAQSVACTVKQKSRVCITIAARSVVPGPANDGRERTLPMLMMTAAGKEF